MSKDYIASREADLLTQTATFANRLAADAESYGISVTQADNYIAAQTAWAAAYQAASDPQTRTRAKVDEKASSRRNIIALTRAVAQIIQANPDVTDAQRLDLGLPVRDRGHSPVHAPTTQPTLEVIERYGTIIIARTHDGAGHPRPAEAIGMQLFSHVGPTPPTELADWRFQGSFTRSTAQIHFDSDLPAGTQVWLTARWFNRRGTGPGCAPVSTVLAGGALTEAA